MKNTFYSILLLASFLSVDSAFADSKYCSGVPRNVACERVKSSSKDDVAILLTDFEDKKNGLVKTYAIGDSKGNYSPLFLYPGTTLRPRRSCTNYGPGLGGCRDVFVNETVSNVRVEIDRDSRDFDFFKIIYDSEVADSGARSHPKIEKVMEVDFCGVEFTGADFHLPSESCIIR